MKLCSAIAALFGAFMLASAGWASDAHAFYGDAPDDHHPWAIHDPNRPLPAVVTPGLFVTAMQAGSVAPGDAVVLFNGTNVDQWMSDAKEGGPTKWIVKDGAMECVPKSGYVRTKEQWGDCQLHVEYACPKEVKGAGQGRGNSGVFPQGVTEVQVLDSYNNETYADGQAAAMYGINPPAVNVKRAPGEWDAYDIVFRRPVYKDGKCLAMGYMTVIHNGALVQDHTPLDGRGGHMRRGKQEPFPEKGPLKFQDHGNPVRFRNVWIRPLPARAVDANGVVSGDFDATSCTQIASAIKLDADSLKSALAVPSDAKVVVGAAPAATAASKEPVGDCQLHAEWAAPKGAKGVVNTGISLMGLLGICSTDAFDGYADPAAKSVCVPRAPGEWQIYDIAFRRPIFKDGKAVDPGYITVFVNGVLAVDRAPIATGKLEGKIGPSTEKAPIKLAGAGAAPCYRNVWYRELPLRSVEGGTDGYLTVEATMAKRKEIAKTVREDADKIKAKGDAKAYMWRLLESLEYDKEDAAYQTASDLVAKHVDDIVKTPADKAASKKDESLTAKKNLTFLSNAKVIPGDFAPKAAIEKFVKNNNFEKK